MSIFSSLRNNLSGEWFAVVSIAYLLVVVGVCMRIIYDTNNSTKTMAYVLLVIFVPMFGILFYFSFGINYRTRKLYSKKLVQNDATWKIMERQIISWSQSNLDDHADIVRDGKGLVNLLLHNILSPLSFGNHIKILFNGEEKYPELILALKAAKEHIHMEYYIYENDNIGNEIKNILIQKAKAGVKVRFIYDDFGGSSIRGKFTTELREGGVEAYAFHKIRLIFLANRLNYRNHRKIVIIDGREAFVGGINVSDRYINSPDKHNDLYWRDTHLHIDGQGCHYLQYLFLCDWNFCSGQHLDGSLGIYFQGVFRTGKGAGVQIAASGPDSPNSTIMLSLLKGIMTARKEILITTPYFIPGDSILDALKVAALSGVSVKLLVPGVSDSKLVNAAAWSYYTDMLRAGVKIYLYRKGFIHSKTMVVDDTIAFVGTANMDYRSFDLNFEVNAVIYDKQVAAQLSKAFQTDLLDAEAIELLRWLKRPMYKQLFEKIARLLSPLL